MKATHEQRNPLHQIVVTVPSQPIVGYFIFYLEQIGLVTTHLEIEMTLTWLETGEFVPIQECDPGGCMMS